MLKKIPTSQDCYYKWTAKKSGETSINLSTEIANYIAPNIKAGEEGAITFMLHKDDFIKAAGYIINILPLYTSTSQSSNKIEFSFSIIEKLLSKVNNFFGTNEEIPYTVNLKYREDGRIYLNNLEYKGFNIREFFVEYFTVLEFEKEGNKIDLKVKVGPISTDCQYLSSEERKVAFFDYIEKKKNGKTIDNYKTAASNPTTGIVIYRNMEKLGMSGMLYDYTDISLIHQLYLNVIADSDNASWNQTCSATVSCYREFLLSFEEKPQTTTNLGAIKPVTGPLQQIFYGAPGTGKSFQIDKDTNENNRIRTTFHPDYDYATFVGAYKPTVKAIDRYGLFGKETVVMKHEDNSPIKEEVIVYKFIPQSFIKAYVEAWHRYADAECKDKDFYLIIEEINRGNCAQIFGDLFQLLDRTNAGFSSYAVATDSDLQRFLNDDEEYKLNITLENDIRNDNGKVIAKATDVASGKVLILPPNLHIWATMNTSDQSLFPIDSAFKRRWDWKYVPIKYDNTEWKVVLSDKTECKWTDLQQTLNDLIYEATDSEDKMLGDWFVKADSQKVISEETLVGKIIFYLWNDVAKIDAGRLFDLEVEKHGKKRKVIFSDFYMIDGKVNTEIVKEWLKKINVLKEERTEDNEQKAPEQ